MHISPLPLVLGVETSCDETGLALMDAEGLKAQALFSQVDLHRVYGGVVPELASRDHIKRLTPLLHDLLQQANVRVEDIGLIAYTQGPGLAGALMTGAAFAQALSWSLAIPSIGVHHMEAHLMAAMLEPEKPQFPFLGLLISGGHTMIVWVEGLGRIRILGDTLDDAVGEAFDKTAKLLGLPYPGGPEVSKLAQLGEPQRFVFPRPMVDRPGLDMSFSGLKTYTLNTWETQQSLTSNSQQLKADICLAFETAVAQTLKIKVKRAIEQTAAKQLVVAGGVSANRAIRQALQSLGIQSFFPALQYCTDNGAMIAQTGLLYAQSGLVKNNPPHSFKVKPRWSLEQLP